MADTTVIIESTDHNASTPLLANGVLLRRVPHNKAVTLTPIEFGVLSGSTVRFKIVDGAGDGARSAAGGADGAQVSASPDTAASERVEREAEQRAAREQEDGVRAEAAARLRQAAEAEASNVTRQTADVAGKKGEDEPKEPEDAAPLGSFEIQQAADAVDEKRTTDADPTPESDVVGVKKDATEGKVTTSKHVDDEGDLNGDRFSAARVLEQPISKITEDLDEFSPRQVRSLLAAEEKREGGPRSTLITALNKKLDAE